MRKILLDNNKKYFRGNMHCHSALSDGKLSPEELKRVYKEKGYSFLAITDHEFFINHSDLDDENFITITSAEYAIKQFPEQSTLKNFDMKVCHLNFYAKKQDNDYCVDYNSVSDHYSKKNEGLVLNKPDGDTPRAYGAEEINKLIKNANDHGFFVCYNHPRWSLENYGDYCGYEGLWGVEIYNHACTVGGLYDYDINVLDDMLRDGKRVFASCGDDNHNSGDVPLRSSFGASVWVNAEELTYDAIIEGLLLGNFYSSQGPVINELYVEDGKVYIKCSDAKRISYSTRGRRTAVVNAAENETVNEAVFEIKDTDGYFRIDVLDGEGNRANTQAYYLDEL